MQLTTLCLVLIFKLKNDCQKHLLEAINGLAVLLVANCFTVQ